jgi:hypothetical protein
MFEYGVVGEVGVVGSVGEYPPEDNDRWRVADRGAVEVGAIGTNSCGGGDIIPWLYSNVGVARGGVGLEGVT